ncbi:PTS lactose/cellobiose transporter subunit IIA [Peptacetobacter sp. AB845]|uniref:PTS lactose/cellobiose transporter subunit IIA n=1 Tax=Peptacetobacter sp. AB845 TaxID=3388429 RepID=UPI0039C900EE
MSTEMQIMELISTAGESKAKAFEALKKVKTRDFDGARALLKEARKIDVAAHNIQTQLITRDLNEDMESPEMSLLMVHAQDHYMTSQLAKDIIEAVINVFEEE